MSDEDDELFMLRMLEDSSYRRHFVDKYCRMEKALQERVSSETLLRELKLQQAMMFKTLKDFYENKGE